MLHIFQSMVSKRCSLYICYVFSLIFFHFSRSDASETVPDFKWVQDYFSKVDETTPIEEVADHLVQLKLYVQSFGYQTPSWDEFITLFKEALGEYSDLLPEEDANKLRAILINKEIQYALDGYVIETPREQLVPYQNCGLKSALKWIPPLFWKKTQTP